MDPSFANINLEGNRNTPANQNEASIPD